MEAPSLASTGFDSRTDVSEVAEVSIGKIRVVKRFCPLVSSVYLAVQRGPSKRPCTVCTAITPTFFSPDGCLERRRLIHIGASEGTRYPRILKLPAAVDLSAGENFA